MTFETPGVDRLTLLLRSIQIWRGAWSAYNAFEKDAIDFIASELEKIEGDRQMVLNDLRVYGRHHRTCPKARPQDDFHKAETVGCTCGFTDACEGQE